MRDHRPSYLVLIDDDDDWRSTVELSLKRILEARNLALRSFSSHLDAAEFFRRHHEKVHGCIVDIKLSDTFDGVDFYNQIIAPLASATKVLFLSGLFEQVRINALDTASDSQVQFLDKGDFKGPRGETVSWLLDPLQG